MPESVLELNRAVYDELVQIARRLLRYERVGISLSSGDLVNEALVKTIIAAAKSHGLLSDLLKSLRGDRRFFKAFVYTQMRRVLVDHARKRKLRWERQVPLHDMDPAAPEGSVGTLNLRALDKCMEQVLVGDEAGKLLLTLRFFGEMTFEQIAEHLGIAPSTARVRAHQLFAKLRACMERVRDDDDLHGVSKEASQ
jgi:RNA polymerase sigma factor (sigma-70 family)